MREAALWTIDELTELVASALAVIAQEADYAGRPNGRVREVPDRRTIRWYTTIGLLDRPAALRGRTALYSRRHLLQLVAVKRLQTQGRSLVEVQEELVGANDAALESIARVPADLGASVPRPTDAPVDDNISINTVADRSARRFWTTPPAAPTPAPAPSAAPPLSADVVAAPLPKPASPRPSMIPAVQLGSGVTLVLGNAGHMPDTHDLHLLEQVAQPLLDLLRQRGLDEPQLGREHR